MNLINSSLNFQGTPVKGAWLNGTQVWWLPPLTIDSGVVNLNTVAFSGVGVNYYSAFERVLTNNNDTSYDAGFEILKDFGIPFARLDISGFWPIYTQLFFNDRAEYFNRLDGVVDSALRNNVGLIPSFFWTTFTYSDLAGENLDQLAVTESGTRQRMREFATAVINRYKTSKAIWAWEFGNEWNLMVDLPNATEFLPPTLTALGNPPTRDPVRDILTTDIILPALIEFGTIAKQLDPKRPISTGHSLPRPSQWHQDQWKRGFISIGNAWDTDSSAEAEEITLRHNPDPYDLVSLHPYVDDISRFANYANYAKNAGKVPFAGEFGVSPAQETSFFTLLSTVTANSPIGAVWVYDRPTPTDPYNITSTNNRSWMLSAIAGLPLPPPTTNIIWTFATPAAGRTITGFSISVATGRTITIDWGDSTSNTINSNALVNKTY